MLLLALLGAAACAALWVLIRRRRANDAPIAGDTTPAIDAWVREALEGELAESMLGTKRSTPEERRRLSKTLRGEPDVDLVSRIEDAVKGVELEFVRYAHESEASVSVRVRYEDGGIATIDRRVAWSDLPESVRSDFERLGGSRVFRTWPFPWARVHAL